MRRARHDVQDEQETIQNDDDEEVPLQHRRPFGSGLKRKRVEFVKAQGSDGIPALDAGPKSNGASIGEIYASIVWTQDVAPSTRTLDAGSEIASDDGPDRHLHVGPAASGPNYPPVPCAVCSLPIVTSVEAHNASLAHQVSLAHSHPPSHLDRSRMGLRALSTQGWDPDARVGLGREGEGMRFPIKVTAKSDTLGIGAILPDKKPEIPKDTVLSAGEVKRRAMEERKKGERLQRDIFGSVDTDKYLTRRKEWE